MPQQINLNTLLPAAINSDFLDSFLSNTVNKFVSSESSAIFNSTIGNPSTLDGINFTNLYDSVNSIVPGVLAEQGDEKHMTPTQLEPLRRCIELYSDPGEVVFSPFNGVGSEGVVAVQKGRKYIGAELKTEYFKLAVENLIAAEVTNNQISFL